MVSTISITTMLIGRSVILTSSRGALLSILIGTGKKLQSDPKLEPLATHACNILRRPMTSAVCERIFSYLTKLDEPSRRAMSAESLRENLFIRAHCHIVERLILRFLDASDIAREERDSEFREKAVAESTANKRMNIINSAASGATGGAVTGGASSSGKRARIAHSGGGVAPWDEEKEEEEGKEEEDD